jgi:hypothetical protein
LEPRGRHLLPTTKLFSDQDDLDIVKELQEVTPSSNLRSARICISQLIAEATSLQDVDLAVCRLSLCAKLQPSELGINKMSEAQVSQLTAK